MSSLWIFAMAPKGWNAHFPSISSLYLSLSLLPQETDFLWTYQQISFPIGFFSGLANIRHQQDRGGWEERKMKVCFPTASLLLDQGLTVTWKAAAPAVQPFPTATAIALSFLWELLLLCSRCRSNKGLPALTLTRVLQCALFVTLNPELSFVPRPLLNPPQPCLSILSNAARTLPV